MTQTPSSNGSGDPTPQKIKEKFQLLQELEKNKDYFGIEIELITIKKDWGISSEECRRLMEDYDHSQAEISRKKGFLKRPKSFLLGLLPFVSQVGLLWGAGLFIWEADKREKLSRNQAWQVVNSIEGKNITASAGRIEALMSLNRGCWEENERLWWIFPPILRKFPPIQFFLLDCVNLNKLKLEGVQLVSIQLPWANLQNTNFTNANLEEANLQNAKLQNTDFTDSRLRDIELQNADLSNAKLNNALMIGANLRGAILKGADLRGTNLTNADLRGANFVDAKFEGAIVAGAIFDEKTKPFETMKKFLDKQYGYFIDNEIERDKNLEKVNLQKIDLSDTNLTKVNLKGSNLRHTKLRNSDLTGANLEKVNLINSDLTGAKFDADTKFKDVIYDEETEKSLPFSLKYLLTHKSQKNYRIESREDLRDADLIDADLRDADLTGADLRKANLTGADLRGTILTGANLENAILTNIIYDITTKFPVEFNERTTIKDGYKLDFNEKFNVDFNGKPRKEKVELIRKDLQFSALKNANLSNGKFESSEFNGSNLSNADLSGADFQKTNLKDVNLKGATVNNKTNFWGATFKNTDIDEIDFTKALGLSVKQIKETKQFAEAKQLVQPKSSSVQPKSFNNIIFDPEFKKLLKYFGVLDGSNQITANKKILEKIDLSNDKHDSDQNNGKFNLTQSEFQNANLQGAKFKNVDLSGSNFFNAKLQGVNFEGAKLKDANLKSATFDNKTNFKNADIEQANFTNALGLDIDQIKKAKNVDKAILSPEFKKKLDSKP